MMPNRYKLVIELKVIQVPLMRVNASTIRRWIPQRDQNTHKGNYGRILLLCGAESYTGAPELAAKAAARTGAGLIFLGVPQCVYPIVASKLTEPMVFPLPDRGGMLSEEAIPIILDRLSQCDACLIGCGLGQSEGTREVVKAVLHNAGCPVVLDADGINVLSEHIDILRDAVCPVVLTPHGGEFRRLGGDLNHPLKEAKRLSRELGVTILLKGHRSLICGGACFVNCCGNAGMATGGSGDALAGILVSLLGQGLSPIKAASAAAWLHGTAGDLCAAEIGQYGMLPSDLIEMLPRLLP